MITAVIIVFFIFNNKFKIIDLKKPININYNNEIPNLGIKDINELNNGKADIIYNSIQSDIVYKINGKFSLQKINSKEDAVMALLNVRRIMNIQGYDFYCFNIEKDHENEIYSLCQLYDGIPVEDGQFTITVNENREPIAVIGKYLHNIEIDSNPKIDAKKGSKLIKISNSNKIISAQLVVYTSAEQISSLCWKYIILSFDGLKKRIAYIDAHSGEQLQLVSMINEGKD